MSRIFDITLIIFVPMTVAFLFGAYGHKFYFNIYFMREMVLSERIMFISGWVFLAINSNFLLLTIKEDFGTQVIWGLLMVGAFHIVSFVIQIIGFIGILGFYGFI